MSTLVEDDGDDESPLEDSEREHEEEDEDEDGNATGLHQGEQRPQVRAELLMISCRPEYRSKHFPARYRRRTICLVGDSKREKIP